MKPKPKILIIAFLILGVSISLIYTYKRVRSEQGRIAALEAPHAQVSSYLVGKAVGTPSSKGKVFCGYDTLGVEVVDVIGVNESVVKQYVWLFCQEYYPQNGTLQQGTGVSTAAVITFKRTSYEYEFIEYKESLDGGLDREENKKLFPEPVLKKARAYQGGVSHLDSIEEARAYFKMK